MLNHFSFPVFVPNGSPIQSPLRDLSGRVTRYQQTISARGWYETATLDLPCSAAEARWWCDQLMASTIIYDDLPGPIWQGVLTSVQAEIDGTSWNVSMDGVATRVRCRYTTVLGTPGTSAVQLGPTSGVYGVKDLVITSDSAKSLAAANTLAAGELARRQTPLATQSIRSGSSGQRESRVTLTFSGWYKTLDWVLVSRSDTTDEATTAQLAWLLGNGAGFNGSRSGIVYDATQIAATGATASRQIAPDTTFRQAIEDRLTLGSSSNQRLMWGVGPQRLFFARPSNERATWDPALSERRTMLRQAADQIVDLRGAPVPPWRVPPDIVLLGADDATLPSAQDRGGRTYIDRVTCEVTPDGASVSLEPLAADSAAARIGALR